MKKVHRIRKSESTIKKKFHEFLSQKKVRDFEKNVKGIEKKTTKEEEKAKETTM